MNLRSWCVVLSFVVYHAHDLPVEARSRSRSKEVISAGDWFGQADKSDIQKPQLRHVAEYNVNYDEVSTTVPLLKRRKLRKQRKHKYSKQEHDEHVKTKKKIKKKKTKKSKTFVKTVLKDKDKDSNMSESKEWEVRGKPVDIIVHIKMND